MRFSRTLPGLLLFAFILVFAVAPGCGAGPEPPAAEQLRRSFPAQAAAMLDRREAFAPVAEGFGSRGASGEPGAGGRVQATLPLSASEAIALRVPANGFKITVRERDAAGESALAGSAVTYARVNGSSFWAATEAGVEEWLMLDDGVARAGQVVASWEIEGGAVRQDGDAIVIDDASGAPRMRVTAPTAFAAGGRAVRATLAAHGATIDLSVDANGEAALVDPLWVAAGALKVARYNHSATVLGNGKVLAAGGNGSAGVLGSVELYDPVADAWTTVSSMLTPRTNHRALLLGNGKVLVVGGTGTAGVLTSAEVYDPTLGTWASTGAMTLPRDAPSMALVGPGNAKVLVTGGVSGGLPTNLTELYDPLGGTWALAAPMLIAHSTHTTTLLGTGEVLVVGGRSTANISVAGAEVYTVSNNTWTAVGPLPSPRAEHNATLLLSGKLGVTGGINWTTPTSGGGQQSLVVYDPVAKTWTQGGGTGYHDYGTATLLANGGLLLAGGNVFPTLVDFLDPLGVAWTNAGPLPGVGHTYHTASLLGNGKVLLAGGYSGSTNTYLQACDLYSPYVASTTCAVAGECQSGFCVDGFCCNAACTGSCQACSAAKTGGANGTCGNVTIATDPDNDCNAQATSTCGTNGLCDGTGKCQLYVSGTSCLGSSCTGSTLTSASTCNGGGTCVAGGTQSCGAYLCAGAVCGTSCTTAANCTVGNVCIAGKCVAPLPTGSVCTAASQCSSGFCTDGFCCGSACNGLCQACSTAKTGGPNGTCGGVTIATDPDNECAAQAQATCGTNGSCNGVGACQLFVTGTSCVAPSCTGSTLDNGSTCDGVGACASAGTTTCAPYVCGVGAACKTTCAADADCTAGNLCIGGKCGTPLGDGSACANAGQCNSGNCVDGVCCNTACSAGACDACSVATGALKDGVCALLSGTACDDGDVCTQNDTCSVGACMPGGPVQCAAIDMCHSAGVCDSTMGGCTNPVVADGSSCVDKDGCTQNDTCQQGKCVGGPVCPPPADGCQVGSCNALGQCDYAPVSDGTSCSDNDACTQTDVCKAGKCAAGTPKVCAPINGCHAEGKCAPTTGACADGAMLAPACPADPDCETIITACDVATGACVKSAKPDGTPCQSTGECLAGSCVGGQGTSSASSGSASTGGTGAGGTGSASTGSAGTGSAGTGSTSTGGVGGGASTGASGSGGNPGDGTVAPAGGCGCSTVGTSESRAPWLLLGLALLAGRRRRQARAAG